MNISDILNASAANKLVNTSPKTAAQATDSLSPVEQAIKKTKTRIQAEVDTTTTQLSSFGQLKSAISNTQLAAGALEKLESTASSASVKTAASNFVSAFNTTLGSAKTTASVAGSSTAATQSANRTGRDLSRSVTTDVRTFDALKKLGFSMGSDGRLALDSKKFEAAQKTDPAGTQATLSKIGKQVETAAVKELTPDGGVNGSMSSLKARSSLLKTQQSSLADLAKTTAAANSTTSASNWSQGFGISAYQSNASNAWKF